MLSENNNNKYFVALFVGAAAVIGLLMFVGCGDDPACGDTGLEVVDTGTVETGTVETGTETGDTGTDTGDTDMTSE
jgi:hypothetical protein